MNTLQQFIHDQHGLREMSLCIAVEQSVAEIITQYTDKYTLVTYPSEISETGNYIIIITPENIASVYNLATQYNSGSWVSITEQPIIPDYKNLSVIGIIDKNTLVELGDMGTVLLSKIGMTIQL